MDLLAFLRKGHTMMLTTQYKDEADMGDCEHVGPDAELRFVSVPRGLLWCGFPADLRQDHDRECGRVRGPQAQQEAAQRVDYAL